MAINTDRHGRRFDQERRTLGCGFIYPYHGKKPTDKAEAIALGILYDLSDRRGIKNELQAVLAQDRAELVSEIAAIIRSGMEAKPPAIESYDALMDMLAAEQPQTAEGSK